VSWNPCRPLDSHEIFDRSGTNPFVHHGRHFGRTIHALCNVQALLTNGILRMGELADQPDESFTIEYVARSHYNVISDYWSRERREHRVFRLLLHMIPGLEDRIMEGSEDEIVLIAELVRTEGIFFHL
jgi:hypothetical protein